jgi:hypothetical protein
MSVREAPLPVPPARNTSPGMRDDPARANYAPATPQPHTPLEPHPYPAEKARGGEIILRRPWQKTVFFAGLAGAVLVVIVLGLLA